MEYDKLAIIEEKLLDAAYLFGVDRSAGDMAAAQDEYEENMGTLAGFDKWSLFNAEIAGRNLIEAFGEECSGLDEEERSVLESWKGSEMRVCEVLEIREGELAVLKDTVSGKKVVAKSEGLIKKGELFIGRIFELGGETHISCALSMSIERKLAETVKGKLREAYEAYCEMNGYATYENYMRGNPWILYKMIEIASDIPDSDEEGALEVFSSVYVVADSRLVKETIECMHDFVFDDADKGIEYYLLVLDGELLCEVEVHPERLVLNANNENELVKARETLEALLGKAVVLSETYSENIEELLE